MLKRLSEIPESRTGPGRLALNGIEAYVKIFLPVYWNAFLQCYNARCCADSGSGGFA
jgi:hypothetical protein